MWNFRPIYYWMVILKNGERTALCCLCVQAVFLIDVHVVDRFMIPIGSIIRWLPRLMRFCSELVYITRSIESSILNLKQSNNTNNSVQQQKQRVMCDYRSEDHRHSHHCISIIIIIIIEILCYGLV